MTSAIGQLIWLMEHHISDSGRKIVRLEEGDYLYSKQNMTEARMRPRENPILG